MSGTLVRAISSDLERSRAISGLPMGLKEPKSGQQARQVMCSRRGGRREHHLWRLSSGVHRLLERAAAHPRPLLEALEEAPPHLLGRHARRARLRVLGRLAASEEGVRQQRVERPRRVRRLTTASTFRASAGRYGRHVRLEDPPGEGKLRRGEKKAADGRRAPRGSQALAPRRETPCRPWRRARGTAASSHPTDGRPSSRAAAARCPPLRSRPPHPPPLRRPPPPPPSAPTRRSGNTRLSSGRAF